MTTMLDSPHASCERSHEVPVGPHNRRNTVDMELIEQSVHSILEAVGEDPTRPGLLDTPRRVARMYAEMFAGLHQSQAIPEAKLK